MIRFLVLLTLGTFAANARAEGGDTQTNEVKTINNKTVLRNGVYAPVFGELRYIGSPRRDSSHNYETFGAKCGFQVFRVEGFAATVGFMGQGAGSQVLEYYGPIADLIAFPESRFHFGLSGTMGKGRIRRYDDGEITRNIRPAAGLDPVPVKDTPHAWDRYGVKVSEAAAYGVVGLGSSMQVVGGVTHVKFTDDSNGRFMSLDANENPSGYAFTLGFRASTL